MIFILRLFDYRLSFISIFLCFLILRAAMFTRAGYHRIYAMLSPIIRLPLRRAARIYAFEFFFFFFRLPRARHAFVERGAARLRCLHDAVFPACNIICRCRFHFRQPPPS